MKKHITILCFALFTAIACNSEKENTIEVNATKNEALAQPAVVHHFAGTIPCADCDGIETDIQLLDNNTYIASRKYVGKSETVYSHTGTYHFDETGAIATLEKMEAPNHFMFIDGGFAQLDINGNLVTGERAPLYILSPIAD